MRISGSSLKCSDGDDAWRDFADGRKNRQESFDADDGTLCDLDRGRVFEHSKDRGKYENNPALAQEVAPVLEAAQQREEPNPPVDGVPAETVPSVNVPLAASAQAEDPSSPSGFLDQAKLAKAKGWHLLNEVTFAAWGAVTAARTGIQIGTMATGSADTFSFSSHLPAGNEGAVVGGLFAVVEAVGTAHLIWKAGRTKRELNAALLEHADGWARFVNGDSARYAEIETLLERKRRYLKCIETWPRDEAMNLLPEGPQGEDPTAPRLKLSDCEKKLRDTQSDLDNKAMALVEDLEHYAKYEQAANELGRATDNLHAMGIAAVRDVVIQLGATACNYAVAVGKAGVPGVDLGAVGIAGGAFSVAMGAMHMAAGATSWYQSARQLEDVQAARSRGLVWQAAESRQQQMERVANEAIVPKPEPVAPAEAAAPAVAPQTEQEKQADIQRANDLIEAALHHRDQAFQAVEEDEKRNIWRSKIRMVYGASSIAVGVGAIVATTVFALVPPVGLVVMLVALVAGTCWLVFGSGKGVSDRDKEDGRAARDKQASEEAKRIIREQGQPTLEQMRNNRFLAIEAMLGALRDRNRPVAKQVLTAALTDLGMDPVLLQALELRSSVRLDGTYNKDRKDLAEKLRCCASAKQRAVLEEMIRAMELRSDEAALKPLRELFQDFIEGKSSLRQEYERRVGFLAFMRAKWRDTFGTGKAAEAQPMPSAEVPAAIPADIS